MYQVRLKAGWGAQAVIIVPEAHIDYFKQETVKSATNLFAAATNAIQEQPTLKKVIIMKQIPRYDPLLWGTTTLSVLEQSKKHGTDTQKVGNMTAFIYMVAQGQKLRGAIIKKTENLGKIPK